MLNPLERCEDTNRLHPYVRVQLDAALTDALAKGFDIHVFEGFRSLERQATIYAQGRTAPGKIITHAQPGLSAHNYGLAIDLVFKVDDQWSWSGDYESLGKIMESHCFEWGKHFKSFSEMDHFQMVFGLSVEEIKAIYDQDGLDAVWRKIDAITGGSNV